MTAPLDPQLNDSDLELLSAYIDTQLSTAESAQLEERLRQEPALRLALDELRATVGLLHELEPLPPPRSFTLDPATVRPRRSWTFPWAGLSTALVGLLCMVAFTVVMFRGGGVSSTSAPMAAAPTAAPMAAQEATAPTNAPAAAGGAAPAAAAATAAPAAATAPPQATPEAAAVVASEPTAAPAFNGDGQGATTRETDPQLATAAPEPQMTASAAEPTAAPVASEPQPGATTQPTGAPAIDQPEPSVAQATMPPAPPQEPMGVVQATVPPESPQDLTQAPTTAPAAAAPEGQPPALTNERADQPQPGGPGAGSDSASADTGEIAPPPGSAPVTQAQPGSSPFRLIAIALAVLLALVLVGWVLRAARRGR